MEQEAREEKTHFSGQLSNWRNSAMDKVLGLFPRRTAEHLINAQKESVLAVRSLLDRSIDALERDLKRVQERPPRS